MDNLQDTIKTFEQLKFKEQQKSIFEITAKLAIFVWLIWILFDYFFAREYYLQFLPVRIGGSLITIALLVLSKKFSSHLSFFNLGLILITIFGVSYFLNCVNIHSLPVYYLGYCLICIITGMVLIYSVKELFILSSSIIVCSLVFSLIFKKYSLFTHLQNGGFLFLTVTLFSVLAGIIRNKNILKIIQQEYKLNELNNSLFLNNIAMKNSLDEREILLREIHHRVKNNLHIISSMLNLQVEYGTNKTPQEIIKASQDRIISMALLHEKLYQSVNFKNINVKTYIESVAEHLHSSYILHTPGVILKCELENKDFTIDTLVPLGLIINELVTNSLKYGKSKTVESEIHIKGELVGESYSILITDNGSGFEYKDIINSQSLGLKLVKGLANQINAKLSHLNLNGCCFNLLIPPHAKSLSI